LETLDSIKPFLQIVISILAESLKAEAAIIDDQYRLITCTKDYLAYKGTEVHVPSVKDVLEQKKLVVSRPGLMTSCKGCRFQDKCPASLELLNSIVINGQPRGLISVSLFDVADETRLEKYQQLFMKPLMETTRLIESFAEHESAIHHLNLYRKMLSQTVELLDDELVLVDKEEKASDSNVLQGAMIQFRSCHDISADQIDDTWERERLFHDIKGSNAHILKLKEKVRKIADTSSTVLITGETGTGKELFAKAIHSLGIRRNSPFIAINCAAIPESLLESELFGYEGGAFTGALKKGKAGFFEIANKGTLLLDEVGDMPLNLQAKVLRAIQEKEIRRVGGREVIPLNIRIIAASNRDLKEAIRQNTFREDLYYRLNVIPLHIPPLRDRQDDVKELALIFLQSFSNEFNRRVTDFTSEALQALEGHSWPGNVRELENAVEYAVNMESGTEIGLNSLPDMFHSTPAGDASLKLKVKNQEEMMIRQALNRFGWDLKGKNQAAGELKIGLRTLYRKIKQYRIMMNDIKVDDLQE
jgi:transcriptional regulator with PAS, ATPase and Fis domain